MNSFKWVYTTDWEGIKDKFKVIRLTKRDSDKYSCTFVNSRGDIEKKIVRENELYQ